MVCRARAYTLAPQRARAFMYYVVKAAVADQGAKQFSFPLLKTMYGGKHIRAKDEIFIISSENERGRGLIARGIVTSVRRPPAHRTAVKKRTTLRISIRVRSLSTAKRPLGRIELKAFRAWQ